MFSGSQTSFSESTIKELIDEGGFDTLRYNISYDDKNTHRKLAKVVFEILSSAPEDEELIEFAKEYLGSESFTRQLIESMLFTLPLPTNGFTIAKKIFSDPAEQYIFEKVFSYASELQGAGLSVREKLLQKIFIEKDYEVLVYILNIKFFDAELIFEQFIGHAEWLVKPAIQKLFVNFLMENPSLEEKLKKKIFLVPENSDLIQFYVRNIVSLEELVTLAILENNQKLLACLKEIYATDVVEKLIRDNGLDSVPGDIKAPDNLDQFTSKYGQIQFNELKPEGMLLACAAIRHAKSARQHPKVEYDFQPVVCQSRDELKDLFCHISANLDEYRSKDIVYMVFDETRSHWTAGTVSVSADKEVKILISDPAWVNYEMGEIISKAIPVAQLYYAEASRQYSVTDCAIFALDDARHLHTVAAKLGVSTVFDYFDEQQPRKEVQDKTTYPLPLHLLRAQQSRKVLNKMEAKDREAFEERYFSYDERRSKKVNKRIDDKFFKMRRYLMQYIGAYPSDRMDAAQSFTVEAFKKQAAVKLSPRTPTK